MPFDFLIKLVIKKMLRENYIGVPTDLGRAQRALDYVNRHRNNFKGWWLLVGRWTEWPNEDVVPLPITTTTKIPEVLGFWKIKEVNLVYEDPNGTLYTPETNFTAVEPSSYQQVTDIRANSVLLSTSLDSVTYGGSFTFRVLGICTSISLGIDVSIENRTFLETEEVNDYFLEWYANCKAVNVSNNADYKVNIIRSF